MRLWTVPLLNFDLLMHIVGSLHFGAIS
jgi:hypothetical protein